MPRKPSSPDYAKLATGIYRNKGAIYIKVKHTATKSEIEEHFAPWPDGDLARQQVLIKQAQNKRSEVADALKMGTFVYQDFFPNGKLVRKAARRSGMTLFGVVATTALEAYREANKNTVRPKTYTEYSNRINKLLVPYFGADRDMSTVDERALMYFFHTKEDIAKLAIPTRNNILSVLNMIFTYAVDNSLCEHNPCNGKVRRSLQRKNKTPEPLPFTRAEIPVLLQCAYESGRTMWEKQTLKNLVQFALFTGLRTGELFGLTWDDVKPTAEGGYRVVISTQVHGLQDFTTTKTRNIRFVDLCDKAVEALESQRELTAGMSEARIKVAINDDDGVAREFSYEHRKVKFVFVNPNTGSYYAGAQNFDTWKNRIYPRFQDHYLNQQGGFVCPPIPPQVLGGDNPEQAVKAFREQAEQKQRNAVKPWRVFYQCRHTYASQLITGGVSLDIVAQQLGHESTATTRKHYARIIEENKISIAPELNRALNFDLVLA